MIDWFAEKVRSGINSVTEGLVDAADLATDTFRTISGIRSLQDENGLGQNTYDFDYKVFPQDLGSDINSHFMLININVPVNRKTGSNLDMRTGLGDAGSPVTLLPGELSKVDNLRFNPTFNPGGSASQRELYSLQRSTRRIAQSIALHMPSSVIYGTMNAYEDISLTSIAGQVGKLGTGIVGRAAGAAAGGFFSRSVEGARRGSDAAGRLVDAAGQMVGTAFSLAGNPINPRIEVLFATTAQRQFVFEVLMAPRNEYESKAIKEIIRTLRFHAAPEVSNIGPIPTYIPPAEFDITFFHKGKENLALPRVNTCVLNRIDIDYAPTGAYSTFSNGHPVAVRLSLSFSEVEIIHKLRVQQGF